MVTALTVALPWIASAQRVDGSIGASLIVLPANAAETVRVTDFRIGRDGIAALRTTAPPVVRTSRIVMTRVASSANELAVARFMPAPSCATRTAECAERELRYRVDVGRSATGVGPRDVRLRIEYLVVDGT